MRTIVHLTGSTCFGGPERQMLGLARALPADQYRTVFLLFREGGRYRLYAGFSAWMPQQLAQELERDAWYVLPAEEALLFREDMDGLWEELVAKATGPRTKSAPAALQSSS